MLNIYKQKLTNLQQEILRVLFLKSGSEINARKLAITLDVTQPAISKALPMLEKEELIIIKKDKNSKRLSISINWDNNKIRWLKKIENLKMLYTSGLPEILEKEFAGGTIILFGSFFRGDDTINSDIDIAIIGRKDKNISLKKYEMMLEREIRINFYDSFEKIHKNFKENLFNGIVLSGGIRL